MAVVFGKYEKIRRLAVGGMGEVFLARQTGVLDRLAILKSLRGDLASEREFVEQFLDEARVAATLNHPNIVSIFDVGEDNGTYYIAMEYVPGEDLSKLWYAAAKAGVGLPFQVSVRVCYEAALGLDHAHKAKDVRGNPLNIVHRDVSPQNIMVRGDGVVKLVDFGIAKAANKSSRTQAGMVKGKLQYMSPEQVRGEALDGRSDQFSLGVVLWEMCTGRRLFKAENEVQTLNKILQAPIPKPSAHVPGFPAELEATILKMISRDAENRFRHLGEVANELKGYLDRSAISTGEVSVAAFVQQILGKELEERTRDLTPMEPTEAGAPIPQPKAKSKGGNGRSGPRLQSELVAERLGDKLSEPTHDDDPAPVSKIVMTAPEDRDTVLLPERDRVRGEVKKAGGGTLRFDDMGVLRQMLLDGQVGPEDSFSTAGKPFQKVKDAKELQKFLEIANATREVSSSRSSARPRAAQLADPAPSPVEVTKPMPAHEPQPLGRDPATLNLGLGAQPGAPATGQFSLGDLPPAMTGTWGAPDIAAAVKNREGITPVSKNEIDTVAPARVPARVPTFVWMLGGVAGALLVVLGALAVLAPELLGLVVTGAETATELQKAVAVVRDDDPSAIDSLLTSVQAPSERRSADRSAAGALLHVARARIDGGAQALAALNAKLDPKAQAPATGGDGIEAHRVAAYKLATEARAVEDGAAAALAMAAYQLERAAGSELEAEAKRASAANTADNAKKVVADELVTLKLLADADAALTANDVVRMRALAARLEARPGDARAHHAALLLSLVAAATADAQARDDVTRAQALLSRLPTTSAADTRPAAVRKALKVLEERVKKAPLAAADAGPARPVAVDAGVAVVRSAVDAGPARANAPDAGPARAAPDAGPVAGSVVSTAEADAGPASAPDAGPPETYESALERGRLLFKQGKPSASAKAFGVALTLKPGAIDAQLGLGWAYVDAGKHDAARNLFEKVVNKDPNRADAYMGLGESLRALGRTEDAKNAFAKYLELAPDGKDADVARNAIRALE